MVVGTIGYSTSATVDNGSRRAVPINTSARSEEVIMTNEQLEGIKEDILDTIHKCQSLTEYADEAALDQLATLFPKVPIPDLVFAVLGETSELLGKDMSDAINAVLSQLYTRAIDNMVRQALLVM